MVSTERVRPSLRWRTVDIVVASVVGAAFGVVFWAWGLLWNGPADAIPLPGRAFMYGVWLVPAVLGSLIIRKPGAGIYTEMVATAVSLAFGTAWGWSIFWQGAIEGAAAELAFLLFAYRAFNLLVASLSGILAGLAASMFDIIVWYPAKDGYDTATMRIPYVAITAVSSLIVAGIGSDLLTRALAQTGALDAFPS
ncbi:MAG TPA: ECF transporter S component, partial [Micromonosporaceae bacterium]